MEKRSLRNMSVTQEYHWPYLGRMILTTLSVIALLFVFGILVINTAEPSQLRYPKEVMLAGFFGLTLAMVVLVVFLGFVTAHRIAGPHINMQQTCEKIANGDFDVRIRFRTEDKLTNVQHAFNTMMDAVQGRVTHLEEKLKELEGSP